MTQTAEQWLLNHKTLSVYGVVEFDEGGYLGVDDDKVYEIMIEFAKLHVEAALKAAHANMQLPKEDLEFTLQSYPLENIK
jgi:hypothetical protein